MLCSRLAATAATASPAVVLPVPVPVPLHCHAPQHQHCPQLLPLQRCPPGLQGFPLQPPFSRSPWGVQAQGLALQEVAVLPHAATTPIQFQVARVSPAVIRFDSIRFGWESFPHH